MTDNDNLPYGAAGVWRVNGVPRSDIGAHAAGLTSVISVPDEIFNQVGSRAAELGISRSEFFTQAARQYLRQLAAASLTQQIDAAIEAAAHDDSSRAAATAGRALLVADDDW